MREGTTILFAGGGTGGHLFPGIAVAEALRTLMPQAKPLFLCTQKEIDRVILEPTGFEFIPQPMVPLVVSIGGLLKFAKSFRETKELVRGILRGRNPAAALGLGGYASWPAISEAARKKIPCAIVNPDVIPGKANERAIKSVKAICCQFGLTANYISSAEGKAKMKVTGCPIRSNLLALPPHDQAAERLGLNPKLLTLAVTGASLGAKTVNEAVLKMLEGVALRGWQILHLSGREHADAVRAGYRALAERGTPTEARIIDFSPSMADVWAVADLAVSRAGASSCAELTACGVPSILLPYPFHKDMHQRFNAKVLADAGAAILVDDEKDPKKNADKLRPILETLLYDADKRKAMAEAAKKLGHPDAAEKVARVMMEMIGAS